MLSCHWFAVDEDGRSWCYREFDAPNLPVDKAAAEILNHTLPGENIAITYAPPDIWSRQKDTGRTMAELFGQYGVPLIKADNNRVQGHMMIKDALMLRGDGKPGLIFFDTCKDIISDIRDIQADDNNPNDCAKEPHELTHSVDSIRYYCVSRQLGGDASKVAEVVIEDDVKEEDYDEYMCGGEVKSDYLSFDGGLTT
jgi:phage terminase large subunit